MAITRAQQAKQMLRKGGRIGLKGGADAATVGFDTSYDTANPRGPDAPRSVDISPTGGVTTSRDAPDAPTTRIGGREYEVLDTNVKERQEAEEVAQARRQREIDEFLNTPRKKNNIPGLLGMGVDFIGGFLPDSRKFFVENVVGKYGFDMTEEDYQEYDRKKKTGEINAYGRELTDFERGTGPYAEGGDDPFIPINQMSTNMNQAPEEVLSPIQQALLDRGNASAFLATGGRVGLKGGADASQFDKSPSEQKSVNVSGGGATLGSGPPEGPDDRGSDRQNTVQYLVNQGYTPKEIRKITKGPTVIDRVKDSRFNNPITRGILRTGLYTLNPALGPLDFRKAMQLKGLYDTTMENIYGDVDMDDVTLGLITDKQKQIIDKNMKMGDAFNPDATFESAKIFDDKGETKTLGIFGEDRPAEPMTREEFDAYVRENRAGGGPVGGIMDLESGRQMYFLGKLVKKATRAVKKIVKSPIGKAALFATPFLMNPAVRTGIGSFLRDRAAPFLFKDTSGSFMDMLRGGLTGKGKFALGAATTLAPLLFQEDTNEDEYQKFLRERGAGAQLPASIADIRNNYRQYMGTAFLADGGRPEPVAKKTMPLLDMDGKEMDFRAEGGFVPIGRMERADDVPARLSKNEFVFTADAVRNAGEGDIDKGAEVMYNMMKNLEAGGEVSEESQGLDGARKMFQTSQRLEEVL